MSKKTITKSNLSLPFVRAVDVSWELKECVETYLKNKAKMKLVELDIDVDIMAALSKRAAMICQITGLNVDASDVASCILSQAITEAMQRDKGVMAADIIKKTCCKAKHKRCK
jgi:hypothetical protein